MFLTIFSFTMVVSVWQRFLFHIHDSVWQNGHSMAKTNIPIGQHWSLGCFRPCLRSDQKYRLCLNEGSWRAHQAKVLQHHIRDFRKRMALDGKRLCRPPGRVEPKKVHWLHQHSPGIFGNTIGNKSTRNSSWNTRETSWKLHLETWEKHLENRIAHFRFISS